MGLAGMMKPKLKLGTQIRSQLLASWLNSRMALTSRSRFAIGVIHHVWVSKMSAYARLKRYRERRSLHRERQYLAKDWQALGTDPRSWTARQCAS